MKNALMCYSKKAMEQTDYFNRCQSQLEGVIPKLIAEIQKCFLIPRTTKTNLKSFHERFGIELPDDIKDYINLFWHASIFGAYDCDKQNEDGAYYKFDEGLVLFPVLKYNGQTDDDVLFQEYGVYDLTEELYEDYLDEKDNCVHADLVKILNDYICIGWTEYSAYKILYKLSTGEIYLESLIEDSVADDKPIASSLSELINKLYFLKESC